MDDKNTASKAEMLLAKVLADIRAGRYRIGSKLPTLRELARENSVSLSVAVKVYDDLRRRNLIKTGGSRGTIVTATAPLKPGLAIGDVAQSIVDLNQTYPFVPTVILEVSNAFADAAQRPGYVGPGVPDPRFLQSAAEEWFRITNVPTGDRQVGLASSGQASLFAILLLLREQLSQVYVDRYTYFGLRFIADALRLELVPVDGDAEGMHPNTLRSLIRTRQRGIIYLMPSLHSPMACTMSTKRIREIAAIAEKHHCPIIEDDPFRYLLKEPPRSAAEAYPRGTFTVATFSKVCGAQTPLGFMAVPENLGSDIVRNTRSSACEIALPQSWIIGDWILSGKIEEVIDQTRAVCSNFRTLVEAAFPPAALSPAKEAPFVWLQLPSHWRSSAFVGAAIRNGVHVAGGDDFSAGDQRYGDHVRVSAFPTADPNLLSPAIAVLKNVYDREQLNLPATV